MIRGVPARPGATQRPRNQAHTVYVPKRPDVIHGGPDVVPVGRNRREFVPVTWWTRRRDNANLPVRRQVARLVHRRWSDGATVAGCVDGEHIEASTREKRHPAVVLVR